MLMDACKQMIDDIKLEKIDNLARDL